MNVKPLQPQPIQPIKPMSGTQNQNENAHLKLFWKLITALDKVEHFKKLLVELEKLDLFLYSHVSTVYIPESNTEGLAFTLEVVERQFCEGLKFLWIERMPILEIVQGQSIIVEENDLVKYIKTKLNIIPKEVKDAITQLKAGKLKIEVFENICKSKGYNQYMNLKEYEEAKNNEKYQQIKEQVESGKMRKANAIRNLERMNLLTDERKAEIEAIEVKKEIPEELIKMAKALVQQLEEELNANEQKGKTKGKAKSKQKEVVTEDEFKRKCEKLAVKPGEIKEYKLVIFHHDFTKFLKRYINGRLSKFDMEKYLESNKEFVDKYPYYRKQFNDAKPKDNQQSPLARLKKTDFENDEGYRYNETIKTIDRAATEKRMTLDEGIDFIRRERNHSVHSARIAMKLYAEGSIGNSQLERNLKENGCLSEKYIAELFTFEFDARRIETYINTWRLEKIGNDDTYKKYLEKYKEYATKK